MGIIKEVRECFSDEKKQNKKNLAMLENKIQKLRKEITKLGKVYFWMIKKIYLRWQTKRLIISNEKKEMIIRKKIEKYVFAQKEIKKGNYKLANLILNDISIEIVQRANYQLSILKKSPEKVNRFMKIVELEERLTAFLKQQLTA